MTVLVLSSLLATPAHAAPACAYTGDNIAFGTCLNDLLGQALEDIATLQADLAAADATTLTLQGDLATAQADIGDLQADSVPGLTSYLTVDTLAHRLTVSGANVQLDSGAGSTEGVVNGLGNLIIGYDEDDGADLKTGSHNLVLGHEHTYTSYGGIVSGENSDITGDHSIVLGGRNHTNAGNRSLIAGGNNHLIDIGQSAIIGGRDNTVSEQYAVIIAGRHNLIDAGCNNGALLGGNTNTCQNAGATITGGINNIASANNSVVLGGDSNTSTVDESIVP